MNIEQIQPLRDQVLVRFDHPELKTKGGIILAGGSSADTFHNNHATVLAVGPGKRHSKTGQRIPNSVKVGDRVAVVTVDELLSETSTERIAFVRDADIGGIIQ